MSIRNLTLLGFGLGLFAGTTALMSVSFDVDRPEAPLHRLEGPGQMAVVVGTPDRTTVLFDDFIDGM